MSKGVECKGNVILKPSHFHFLSISLSSRQTPSTGRVRSLGSEHAWGCSLPRERTLMGQDMICFANSRNCLFDEFVLALIRTYSTESTVADSRGAKDYENIIHKVSIRLGKRPIIEEEINVEEKSVDEQPHNDVVPPVVVVPAPNVDFRIQFITDRKFEQRVDMLTWVRDLSEKLGFVVVITKSDNGMNGRKGYVALGC
jgi:hypothetical protein